MYDLNDFTWGLEIEVGDIPRTALPASIGTWDQFETDVVNQRAPYKGIAVDPFGINPPVGGEINTRATKTIEEQLDVVRAIKQYDPTVSCVSNTHIHVYVPGLFEDAVALKKLCLYILHNQNDLLKAVYSFEEVPEMKETETALTYLRDDSGSAMPLMLIQRIVKGDDFTKDFEIWKYRDDNRLRRYAINLASLAYIGTVEFRCFRATLDIEQLNSCMQMCKLFLDAALNNGPSVKQILAANNFTFPPLNYDHELYLAWEQTKRPYRGDGLTKPHMLQVVK